MVTFLRTFYSQQSNLRSSRVSLHFGQDGLMTLDYSFFGIVDGTRQLQLLFFRTFARPSLESELR